MNPNPAAEVAATQQSPTPAALETPTPEVASLAGKNKKGRSSSLILSDFFPKFDMKSIPTSCRASAGAGEAETAVEAPAPPKNIADPSASAVVRDTAELTENTDNEHDHGQIKGRAEDQQKTEAVIQSFFTHTKQKMGEIGKKNKHYNASELIHQPADDAPPISLPNPDPHPHHKQRSQQQSANTAKNVLNMIMELKQHTNKSPNPSSSLYSTPQPPPPPPGPPGGISDTPTPPTNTPAATAASAAGVAEVPTAGAGQKAPREEKTLLVFGPEMTTRREVLLNMKANQQKNEQKPSTSPCSSEQPEVDVSGGPAAGAGAGCGSQPPSASTVTGSGDDPVGSLPPIPSYDEALQSDHQYNRMLSNNPSLSNPSFTNPSSFANNASFTFTNPSFSAAAAAAPAPLSASATTTPATTAGGGGRSGQPSRSSDNTVSKKAKITPTHGNGSGSSDSSKKNNAKKQRQQKNSSLVGGGGGTLVPAAGGQQSNNSSMATANTPTAAVDKEKNVQLMMQIYSDILKENNIGGVTAAGTSPSGAGTGINNNNTNMPPTNNNTATSLNTASQPILLPQQMQMLSSSHGMVFHNKNSDNTNINNNSLMQLGGGNNNGNSNNACGNGNMMSNNNLGGGNQIQNVVPVPPEIAMMFMAQQQQQQQNGRNNNSNSNTTISAAPNANPLIVPVNGPVMVQTPVANVEQHQQQPSQQLVHYNSMMNPQGNNSCTNSSTINNNDMLRQFALLHQLSATSPQ